MHQLARRALGELILHQLARRALGELAMYQLSGSWKAGIFLPACQEATLVSWYGMYQLARRHSLLSDKLKAHCFFSKHEHDRKKYNVRNKMESSIYLKAVNEILIG
jgi:hypothetical protein